MGLNTGLVGACLGICAALPALSAQDPLGEPRPISPSGSRATQVAIAVDAVDNAFLSLVSDGKVRVVALTSSSSSESVLWDINIPQEDPAIEVTSLEVAFAAFAIWDNELGARGREIVLASNLGGSFGPVLNLSSNGIDDRSPRMALDPGGSPRLVWVQESPEGPRILFYEHLRGAARAILEGDRPSLAVDGKGRAHVAFWKDGSLRVADQGPLDFGDPVEIDRPGEGEWPAPLVGVDGGGRLTVLYSASGELRLAARSGESFDPPRVLDRGLPEKGALDAHLSGGGRLVAVYLKEGDVFLIRGEPGGDLGPEQMTRTEEEESSPAVREDPRGNLHLCFIREGRAYYVNSAALPQAEFSAEPAGGELPLEVEFRDLSGGEVRAWKWSFGDGGISSERNPVHIYREAGAFSVELEVSGPGGDSRIEKDSLISVQEASNTMRVADVAVLSGQTGVWTAVIGLHREPVQGFQVAGRFVPQVVTLREISLRATASATYDPEFFSPSIANDEGFFTAGIILDYMTPFDGRKIRAGSDQRLVHLVFDVSPLAQPGESMIELANGVGPSSMECLYTVDGTSRRPVLSPGRIRVLPAVAPLPRRFLRGDFDLSGEADFGDVMGLIGFEFTGLETSACADALDVNDSGAVDLSDIIFLLTFIYLDGAPPVLPYPGLGLDLTDDPLPPCTE